MAKFHGRTSVFKIDNVSGGYQDISAFCDTVKTPRKTDRPRTPTFGDSGGRYQVKGLRGGATIAVGGYYEQAAASKAHGRNTRVVLGAAGPPGTTGGFALTGFLNMAKVTRKVKWDKTPTFGSNDVTFDVMGLLDTDVSIKGYFDGGSGAIHDIMRAVVDWDPQSPPAGYTAPFNPILTVGGQGFAIGNYVEMVQVEQTDYSLDAAEEKTVDFDGTFVADDLSDLGVSLHDLVAETGVNAFTSVNQLASTANGGIGHLIVTAFGGTVSPSFTIKIQHSPDNSTWADLVVFTNVTGATAALGAVQRAVVAAGTTVNQYLRANITAVSGTNPTCTFQLSFARRNTVAANLAGLFGTHPHWVALIQQQANAAQLTQSPWVFEYDPAGTTVTYPKYTGTVRVPQYDVSFEEEKVVKFNASLLITGAVTEASN